MKNKVLTTRIMAMMMVAAMTMSAAPAVYAAERADSETIKEDNQPTEETADAPSAPMMVLDGFTEKRLDILLREMKAYGVSVPYKAMVTEHNIGWTLSDLFTELVREHEAMHQ